MIFVCVGVQKISSYDFVNICILFLLVIMFLKFIMRKIKISNSDSKNAMTFSRGVVYNENTLINNYCIVRYFKDERIVVIDNPKLRKNSILRAFVLDKNNFENIDAWWLDICSVFDYYTYFDSLLSFVDKAYRRLNIVFLDSEEKFEVVKGMEEFLSHYMNKKTPITHRNKNGKNYKIDLGVKGEPITVNFSDLKKQEVKLQKKNEDPNNVVNFKDLKIGKKIYINSADAETISILPGINIIKAKRLVSYRDVHGAFKDKEEFIAVCGAKEHFREKIMEMITLEKYTQVVPNTQSSYSARIVD